MMDTKRIKMAPVSNALARKYGIKILKSATVKKIITCIRMDIVLIAQTHHFFLRNKVFVGVNQGILGQINREFV